MHVCLVPQSCLTLRDPMDCVVHQVPVSVGFSRQEYRNGLSWSPPGNLPNPGIKLASPVYPALAGDSLPLAPPGRWC